ncbi:Uncharacterised protein [Candidatus Bartonella washoeensis]|nr:Uncharacterised protein [Bartonella washoeensis]
MKRELLHKVFSFLLDFKSRLFGRFFLCAFYSQFYFQEINGEERLENIELFNFFNIYCSNRLFLFLIINISENSKLMKDKRGSYPINANE